MPAYIDIDAALKYARELAETRQAVLDMVGIVRNDLRHAVAMGGGTREQRAEIEALFPTRTRKAKAKAKREVQP